MVVVVVLRSFSFSRDILLLESNFWFEREVHIARGNSKWRERTTLHRRDAPHSVRNLPYPVTTNYANFNCSSHYRRLCTVAVSNYLGMLNDPLSLSILVLFSSRRGSRIQLPKYLLHLYWTVFSEEAQGYLFALFLTFNLHVQEFSLTIFSN